MPFAPGESGNPDGRPKGSKNKNTEIWDNFCEFLVNNGAQRFLTELQTLEGKDYTDQFQKIVEFAKPKLARTEVVGDKDAPLTINLIKYGDRPSLSVLSTNVPAPVPSSDGTKKAGSVDRPS